MNRQRIVAAAAAILGAVGLGLTLLPLITVSASDRLISVLDMDQVFEAMFTGQADSIESYWSYVCETRGRYCDADVAGQVHINGYDVLTWGYPVGALIPIALALTIATGALYAWRGRDPRVFTLMSLASAGALFVLLFTWIDPSVAIAGSGELAELESASSGGELGSDFTVSIGAGVYAPAAVLTVICLLTAWQAVETSNLFGPRRSQHVGMPVAPAPAGQIPSM